MEVVVNDREALARRELIQQIALELLRSWGFYAEQLKHLFAGHHSGGRPRKQDELEDAVLDAFTALWGELQSGKIRRIGRETVRYRLIEALRRRGLDRRPYTTHELLVGIATSHRAQTHRRYLSWAKYELQEELGKRFAASFSISDHPSLEGLSDYFLAEFVSRQYELLDGSSSQSGSLLDRLCAAFSGSSDHRRRACQYCPWITPVCPRLGFRQEVPQHELENYAWTTFAEQPEYEACVALERLRYQDRLVRCHRPDDRLAHFLTDLRDPAERRRLELCLIFAQLKRESRRALTGLKAYMIYVFSHFPAVGRAKPPQVTPLEQVTLDMIQGCRFSWVEVCRRFPGGPRPGDYMTKRRIERDLNLTARALGFASDETDAQRGAENAIEPTAERV